MIEQLIKTSKIQESSRIIEIESDLDLEVEKKNSIFKQKRKKSLKLSKSV